MVLDSSDVRVNPNPNHNPVTQIFRALVRLMDMIHFDSSCLNKVLTMATVLCVKDDQFLDAQALLGQEPGLRRRLSAI